MDDLNMEMCTIYAPKILRFKPAWVLRNQEITKILELMHLHLPDYAIPEDLKVHFTEDR